jgi:hypothetical protein
LSRSGDPARDEMMSTQQKQEKVSAPETRKGWNMQRGMRQEYVDAIDNPQPQPRYINNGQCVLDTRTWEDLSVETELAMLNNAEKLAAALRDVEAGYQKLFDVMPVAWQTYDNIVSTALAAYEANKNG